MHTRRWQRVSARILLATFPTFFVACGGGPGEAPTPTTIPAVQSPPPTPPPTVPPAPPPTLPAPAPTLPTQAPAQLGKQELRDLVAPVALYPDVVLASLLPASTNPDQIHDAAQYVGQAAHVDQIPEDRGWDGSVVGLLQFPDVLRWLDNNPAWTDQMGLAVTYQQADVLNAIQDYRRSVRDVGNLKSNQYQTVRGQGSEDIRIEPAQPSVVYVPSYDPVAATQPQPPPEQAAASGINPWLAFGGGAVVGALGAWALYSVFDDDDHGHTINHYNNYYYGNGRRPPKNAWQAQPRQYPNRARNGDWQRTRRLDYAPQTRAAKAGSGLRPPMTAPAATAPTPRQVKREQRQEHQAQKQERQQEQRQQRQTEKQQNQAERQQRQADKQRAQQEQRQQRQTEKQQNQAERQQKQAEQRQRNQAEKQQRQMQRQENQADRQQHQAEQRQQRQEQRKQQAQEQPQQNGKKKKKQGEK